MPAGDAGKCFSPGDYCGHGVGAERKPVTKHFIGLRMREP